MKKIALIGLCASVLTLASCGGSSTSTSAIAAYLQTPVAATYTDPDTLSAFNAINTFRNTMGLGYWSQNTLLDLAAANHMHYSTLNDPTYQVDLEVAANQGFTGLQATDRALSVGYGSITAPNVVGEFYSTGTGTPTLTSTGTATTTGATIIDGIVNTIYHRSGLLAQTTREVGIARNDLALGSASAATHWWINHGRLDTGQYNASTFTMVYPISGQIGVPLHMDVELPQPFPDVSAAQTATSLSSPISFSTAQGTTITVTTFTVTPSFSTTPLSARLMTMTNDPNLYLASHEAYLVANAPFLPNTTYNVSFTGTSYLPLYGITTALAQNWSFTTGSN